MRDNLQLVQSLETYKELEEVIKNETFCGGFQRDTYSAVLNNAHRDGKSFEASYAVLALQMLPHAVGFFKRAPFGRRRQ